jgi:hypothetical protein
MTDTLINKQVTTRKPHHCWGCAREFPVGSVLQYTESVDAGEFGRSYWCPVCAKILPEIDPWDYGVNYGEVRNSDIEAWEETRAKMEDTCSTPPNG